MSKPRERLLIIAIIVFAVTAVCFFAYQLHNRVVRRNAAPVITCASDEIRVSVTASDEELLSGVTAFDLEDGDLTESVIVEGISRFVERGKCTISYAVADSKNKVSTVSRTLYYTDYTPPRFELLSDLVFPNGVSVNPLAYVRAYDCFDGDITNRITMTLTDDENLGSLDTRHVEFRVSNSYGDVSILPADFSVQERQSASAPSLKLSKYIVYMTADELIDPLGYVESITLQHKSYAPDEFTLGTLSADTDGFDPGTPGVYRIPIQCEADGYIGSTALLVVVED